MTPQNYDFECIHFVLVKLKADWDLQTGTVYSSNGVSKRRTWILINYKSEGEPYA